MTTGRRAFLLLMLCLLLAAPAAAQEEADNPLLRLLRFVPNVPAYRASLTYGDVDQWYASWGFEPVADRAELEARWESREASAAAVLYVLPGQLMPGDALDPTYLFAEDQRGFAGFDLLNIDRFIQVGAAPETITAFEFDFAPEQISSALLASGYSENAYETVTYYERGADYAYHNEGPMRSFQRGMLNRVVLMAQAAIVGRASDVVRAGVAAEGYHVPNLAEDPASVAAASALLDPAIAETGGLVGVQFIDPLQFGNVGRLLGERATPETIAALEAELRAGVTLPQWELAAFATKHAEDGTHLVLAVVFPEGVDAQSAADAVRARLESYRSQRFDRPMIDILTDRGVTVEWARGIAAAGRPVALVSLHAPDPTFQREGDGPLNTGVFKWSELVMYQDVWFLAVTGE